ncbi:MAG: hypothetical protein A3K03_13675 [Bdellovibrionales bacterium RIFOXYD1_FULL_44_7]|nr:MAG: hypothetical protein A3K03_13675 [Bdellovibrionales bacterium RIFOXYD1_FULL_44_7]
MGIVEIYTMPGCPYCDRAKNLLKKRGVEFRETVVSYSDDAMWEQLYKKSGMKTVPQIFQDGAVIGGYSELTALDGIDQLESLRKKD